MVQPIPEAKQAFYDDKLTVAHAFEVAQATDEPCRRAFRTIATPEPVPVAR